MKIFVVVLKAICKEYWLRLTIGLIENCLGDVVAKGSGFIKGC